MKYLFWGRPERPSKFISNQKISYIELNRAKHNPIKLKYLMKRKNKIMFNEEYQYITKVVLGVSGEQVGGILQETKQARIECETSHGTHVILFIYLFSDTH